MIFIATSSSNFLEYVELEIAEVIFREEVQHAHKHTHTHKHLHSYFIQKKLFKVSDLIFLPVSWIMYLEIHEINYWLN